MQEQIKNLVSLIFENSDDKEIKESINYIIAQKVANRLNELKEEVADDMFNKELTEVSKRSRAILPASRDLGHGNKSSIEDIAKDFPDANVQVAAHGFGDKKIRYVVSSGDMGDPVGTFFDAHHDQTRKNLGYHTIVNNIRLKDGKLDRTDNNIGVKTKHPMYVYK